MLIHVKVEADSKKDSVEKKNNTSYLVTVKVPAERNMANTHMLALMATHLGIPKNKLRIITGHHMPSKILDVLS